MSYEVNVRHRLSAGLIVFAALLSAFLVVGLRTANVVTDHYNHVQEPKPIDPVPWSLRNDPPRANSKAVIQENHQVNHEATHEIKQQCGTGCSVPNPASRTFAQVSWGRPYGGDIWPGKVLPDGSVVVNVGPSATKPPVDNRPKPQPAPSPRPNQPEPDLVIPLAPVNDLPPKKEIQVIVFHGNDNASKAILSWFDRYPSLVDLKNQSDFQEFTPENKLYQARYASKFPASKFPFVVVQDSEGGHIHIAGGGMLPRTPEELASDISVGIDNYKSAQEGGVKNNGLITKDGYSWDAGITPDLRLEDCGPDGCPVDQVNSRPRPFLDWWQAKWGKNKSVEALVWVNAKEIANIAVWALVGVLVLTILLRKK